MDGSKLERTGRDWPGQDEKGLDGSDTVLGRGET